MPHSLDTLTSTSVNAICTPVIHAVIATLSTTEARNRVHKGQQRYCSLNPPKGHPSRTSRQPFTDRLPMLRFVPGQGAKTQRRSPASDHPSQSVSLAHRPTARPSTTSPRDRGPGLSVALFLSPARRRSHPPVLLTR
ncbi:hypothetical protein AK830_g11690 [Neonectria ditissima]|uniref:Uncharacterized protein n=1 Tax=Neonectria ditissima TaxID=78410 RepID=A0A0P7B0R5_9HYPO|nr:hypothetical protein AK830_g11690 [Neonectria ditissima]